MNYSYLKRMGCKYHRIVTVTREIALLLNVSVNVNQLFNIQ